MKMTIILDEKGTLVAAQQGADERGREAGLVAGPGQRLHQVDVPEELTSLKDSQQFVERMKAHLPKG
jgi:hypothetical protein